MKKTSGRGGTRAWPGFTISKPRKLNVRTSLAGRNRQEGQRLHNAGSLSTVLNYSSHSRLSRELTAVFSVLVKADVDTFNLQVFLSILQESSETGGQTGQLTKTHPRVQNGKTEPPTDLSLLSSGSRTRGISTKSALLLRTASHWIVFVVVGRLWKRSIPGRPFPAGSSVTVNFRS